MNMEEGKFIMFLRADGVRSGQVLATCPQQRALTMCFITPLSFLPLPPLCSRYDDKFPYLGGGFGLGAGHHDKMKYYGGGGLGGGRYGGGDYHDYYDYGGILGGGRDKWSSPVVGIPPPIVIVNLPRPILTAPPPWQQPILTAPPSWIAPPIVSAPRPISWSAPLGAPPVSLCLIACQGGLTAPAPAYTLPTNRLGSDGGESWSGGGGGNLGAPTGPLCAVPCTPVGRT
jgi:hypothetical protein